MVLLLSGGVGMLLQGALMLTADIFAERRGIAYMLEISRQHQCKNVLRKDDALERCILRFSWPEVP